MDNSSGKPVAVVTGVGPGLGAALVRRSAATYAIAMLARKADYLKALAGEIRQAGPLCWISVPMSAIARR